jgi:DNA-binding NarL/FixJ family response regulator
VTVTVFLVDDHAMVRAGVRAGLSDDFEVVGEAGTVPQAIAGIADTSPDVVLLDVHLPDGGGDAITRVAEGDVVFSPRLAGFVLDAFRATTDTPPADRELDLLTPRELEVLRLLARGYSYKEVAAEMFISTKTVETHASSVLRKLQLSNRHQLTRWAADRRML